MTISLERYNIGYPITICSMFYVAVAVGKVLLAIEMLCAIGISVEGL